MLFYHIKDFTIDAMSHIMEHSLRHFVPVLLGIGICVYFNLDNEPDFSLNIAITFVLFACTLMTEYKKTFFAGFLICFVICVAQIRTQTMNTPQLQEKTDTVKFAATVESCEKTPDGMRFIVSDIEKFHLNKMILNWRTKKQKNYNPGDRVLFRAKLYPLTGQAFPLAYDFKRQQYFKGIGARGFITSTPGILKGEPKFSLSLYIEKIRHKLNKKIESVLSGDTAAISKALITGEKAAIPQKVREKFANSGTAHLLAISGLHMGIIGFFIFWLFRIILCCIYPISRLYDVKKIAAVISLCVVTVYLYISGCSVPSIRAFIMHTLIIIGIMCNRVALSMRSIVIAATLIMLFSPEVITFPGFQMSFSAVIAIVALYENRNELNRAQFILGIILTTLAASIPTSLFSIFSFNQFTLNSILANIVCIPLMTFIIMPLAVVSLAAICCNLYALPITLFGYCIDVLIKIVDYASTLPGSHFAMYTPSPITMCIFIFSGLCLTLIHHKIRWAGLIGIFIGFASYYRQELPDIFISPYGTVVGVRTSKCACFSNLQRFKSVTTAWTKSVGLEKKENLKSKTCRKYLQKCNDGYHVNLNNRLILINSKKNADIYLDYGSPYAKQIYLPSLKQNSTEKKRRPWS